MAPSRRLPGRALVFLSLVCTLILNTIYAQQPADHPIDYGSFDARSALPSVPHGAKGARAYASGAMQQSGDSFSHSLFDLAGPITGPRSGDPATIARDYLSRKISSLRTKAASPFSLPLVARYESADAGLTHLTFQPSYAGVAHFDSEIQVHIGPSGEIWRVNRKPLAPAPATLSATLSPRTAVEAALHRIAPEIQPRLQVVDPKAVLIAGPCFPTRVWPVP